MIVIFFMIIACNHKLVHAETFRKGNCAISTQLPSIFVDNIYSELS